MQKIKFTDPQTNDVVEFAVEEETTLNGTRYLLVSEGEESGDCEAYILKEVSSPSLSEWVQPLRQRAR